MSVDVVDRDLLTAIEALDPAVLRSQDEILDLLRDALHDPHLLNLLYQSICRHWMPAE